MAILVVMKQYLGVPVIMNVKVLVSLVNAGVFIRLLHVMLVVFVKPDLEYASNLVLAHLVFLPPIPSPLHHLVEEVVVEVEHGELVEVVVHVVMIQDSVDLIPMVFVYGIHQVVQ